MGAKREPLAVYGGGDTLPAATVEPGDAETATIYWPGQTVTITAGQAVTLRGRTWLVEDVATWQGRPGGTTATIRECNVTGTLHHRTATPTAYGVTHIAEVGGVQFVGVLGLADSLERNGQLTTTAHLTPAGTWQGTAGDLLTLDDGTQWEQVGEPTQRTLSGGTWTGRHSRLPVVALRRT